MATRADRTYDQLEEHEGRRDTGMKVGRRRPEDLAMIEPDLTPRIDPPAEPDQAPRIDPPGDPTDPDDAPRRDPPDPRQPPAPDPGEEPDVDPGKPTET